MKGDDGREALVEEQHYAGATTRARDGQPGRPAGGAEGNDHQAAEEERGGLRLTGRVVLAEAFVVGHLGERLAAERRSAPSRAPASADRCPLTGGGRLSYERAEYLFKQHSLRVAKQGWTLHQLRHSALTHLAEAGVNLPCCWPRADTNTSVRSKSTPGQAPRRPRP